eukprot:COSAG02_NODE_2573_length_8501_cov_5.214473_3_plen_174_part_00
MDLQRFPTGDLVQGNQKERAQEVMTMAAVTPAKHASAQYISLGQPKVASLSRKYTSLERVDLKVVAAAEAIEGPEGLAAVAEQVVGMVRLAGVVEAVQAAAAAVATLQEVVETVTATAIETERRAKAAAAAAGAQAAERKAEEVEEVERKAEELRSTTTICDSQCNFIASCNL